MRFLPGFSLFDDAFNTFFDDSFHQNKIMKTDVLEKDGSYILNMELPGFKKEDIKMSLKDGYLTISAQRDDQKEEKDDKGNIVRQERYRGSCKRSFYVGTGLKEEDIKAKFEDGELKVTVPQEEARRIENETKYISIE